MGVAGYGAAKFIRSGAAQDNVRAELIESLTPRLSAIRGNHPEDCADLDELSQLAAVCVAGGLIDENSTDRVMALVESVEMTPELAISRLKAMALEAELISTSNHQPTS
ncbi:MAG: hypothetical protein ACI8RN_002896 [Glaciecola sp.]|jgi:hypothetical protein|uniref:hypothetical protein n=1 Tax=Congregibacter sp. TaxID=2744308 RepID=UPI0039E49B53